MRSAYMIAYRDTDFLEVAIDSVIDHVDEVVFIDGAYRWMADHLRRSGMDPERTGEAADRVLARYGDKIRYFSGLWDDELHKRGFGFSQCRGDIVIRIDADECMRFDDAALSAFTESPSVAASMYFPLMVFPDLCELGVAHDEVHTQAMFFKREAFPDPLGHCAYLWLVLSEEERARVPEPDWSRHFATPVGLNMHLSSFRTTSSAVTRARFYILHWVLGAETVPWAGLLESSERAPGQDYIEYALSALPASDFESWLEGTAIVSGLPTMSDTRLKPVDLSPRQRQISDAAFATLLEHRAVLADFEARPRFVIDGHPSAIDVSRVLAPGARSVELEFEQAPGNVSISLLVLSHRPEASTDVVELDVTRDGCLARASIPPGLLPDGGRIGLEVTAHGLAGDTTRLVRLSAA